MPVTILSSKMLCIRPLPDLEGTGAESNGDCLSPHDDMLGNKDARAGCGPRLTKKAFER